jgi:hypothetical protein
VGTCELELAVVPLAEVALAVDLVEVALVDRAQEEARAVHGLVRARVRVRVRV